MLLGAGRWGGVFPINDPPPTTKKQSQGGKREWQGWYKFNDSRVIDWCDCHHRSCTPFLQHVNTDIGQSTFLTGQGKCNRKLEKKKKPMWSREMYSSFVSFVLLIFFPSVLNPHRHHQHHWHHRIVWSSMQQLCCSISLCISLVNISLACFPYYCKAKRRKKNVCRRRLHFHQVVVTDKSR